MKLTNLKILLSSFLSGTCHSPFYSHNTHYENFHLWKENYFEKQKLTVNFQFSKTLGYLPSHFHALSSFHIKQTGLWKFPKRKQTNKKTNLSIPKSSCQKASCMTDYSRETYLRVRKLSWMWSTIPSTDLSPLGSNNYKQTWEVRWSCPHDPGLPAC